MRIAVIGAGFQGRLHLEALAGMERVTVVGVCDRDLDRARAAVVNHAHAKPYADYRELLDRESDLDLVTVCTMPQTHCEIVCSALIAGAHVLCEKPFATSAVEAVRMVELAEERKRLLAVGFNMRFMGSAIAVREWIEDGQLGRPVCARGFMLADNVPWWGRHYVREMSGGGALASTAVHMIDLVRWLAGNPAPLTATASATRLFPRKRGDTAPTTDAAASYDVEDIVFGHIRFDNGFWMSIEGAWVWDKPGWNYGFDLVGEHAQASFAPLELTDACGNDIRRRASTHQTDTDFPQSVRRELKDVVEAIRDGRSPATAATAKEALVTQVLVDALYESARNGAEVNVRVPAPMTKRRTSARA